MFCMTVLYGHPKDTTEFDRYYEEVHTPLVMKVQGLKGLKVTRFGPGPRGEQPQYYLMAQLYANNQEEFNAIMSTPEGRATGADVRNFATGGATFLLGNEESHSF